MRCAVLLTSALALLSPTARPAAAEIAVTGQIALAGGGPASDVEVVLIRQTTAYEFGRLVLEGRHDPDPAASARTGGDGRFELRAPEAGMWHLRVAPAGYRPMELYLTPLLEERNVPTLELVAESPVAVRVTGADGAPLAGAHVRADSPPSPRRGFPRRDDWRAAYRQAFAGADGVAGIGRGADEALHLYAIAAGHLEAERAGVRAGSVALTLEAATPRALRIVDPRGRPVAEATLRLGERRWPVARTDGDGLALLALPAAGELRVQAYAADGRQGGKLVDPAGAAPDAPLDLALAPSSPRSGRVVDSETRRPIPGAFVWSSGQPAAAVRSDAAGGFTLDADGDDERVWLWAAAAGYHKEAQEAGAGAGDDGALTLALAASLRARGIVVDASGRAVRGAEVTASVDPTARRPSALRSSATLDPAISDGGGRFSLAGLHPDASYVVRARKAGFASAEIELPRPREDTARELRIVLEGGRRAIGTVVGPSGEPVAGARVTLEKSVRSGSARRLFLARFHGTGVPLEGTSDADGRFAIQDVPAGTFDLEATAPGWARAARPGLEVLAEAAETDFGEIELEPGAALEGRITDARGAAVEGAEVFATETEEELVFVGVGGDDDAPAAVSAADGSFTVPDRRPGEKVDLRVEASGYATASVAGVEAPTVRPLSVRLFRSSKLRGHVVDSTGRPVAGALVWLQILTVRGNTSSSMQSGRTTTAEDGRFTIEEVSPGEIELHVRADGYRSAELKSLTVEPERDLEDLRIVLEPGATISGRVTDALGRPVPGAMVLVSEQGTRFGGLQSLDDTDAEGRYRLEGVSPGRRTVFARHDDHPPVSREIDAELGDNLLDLAFEGGATVSGRVLGPAGEPVAGAEINLGTTSMLVRFGGDSQPGLSDTSGAFSIGGVAAGTYTLQAQKEGYATGVVEDLEVGAGDLHGVEIRLSRGSAIVGRLLGLDRSDYLRVQIIAVRPPATFSLGRIEAEGGYRIDDLAPGEYTVRAQVGQRGRSAQGTASVVEGAAETLLDLEFRGGLTLSGVVLRGDEPLTGTTVSADGLDVASEAGGVTDSRGRFELRGLEPGRHLLSVGNFQTGLAHREEIDLTSDRDVVLRVEAARVSGTVLDATDSRPVAGATLRLESLAPRSTHWRFSIDASVTTDSAGFFRFSEASAGPYRLVAHKDGYAPAETPLTLLDGLDQEGLEVLLEPSEGLRVFVTLPSGLPAAELYAALLDDSGRTLSSGVYSSGAEGTVLSVPAGEFELLVSAADTATASLRARSPGEPLAIALRAEALLEVRVPALAGEPALAVARVTGADGRPFRSLRWSITSTEWPLADGRTIVGGLAPGPWIVTVEAPDGRRWQGQATLAAGANPELVLE